MLIFAKSGHPDSSPKVGEKGKVILKHEMWRRNILQYSVQPELAKYIGAMPSGLYYKLIMIVIDTASVVSKWCSKL